MKTVLNSWFDNWLLMHVPSIVDQPKWFKNDHNLKGGNIVVFKAGFSTIKELSIWYGCFV